MSAAETTKVDVAIVGGGPAGLSAAVELKRRGIGDILVLEREAQWGGIPRHCNHIGFGIFDLHRCLSGPGYARKRARLFQASGAEGLLETSVLGWDGDGRLRTTSPKGLRTISAKAILLATGCRERPRAARLVPGDRPLGVFTTGSLQQLGFLNGKCPGTRAIVVGAEHVSFSAIHTLAACGTRTAAMITEHPTHQSYGVFRLLTAGIHRVPILTHSKILRIIGREKVEAVEVLDLLTHERKTIPCDCVVFTGDWIPANELARMGKIALDPRTFGPRVDLQLRTSRQGVFAAGNLLRGAETADTAALEGRFAAASIARYLEDGNWAPSSIPIEAENPLEWISPSSVAPSSGDRSRVSEPPRGRFIFRVKEPVRSATLEIRQGDRLLFTKVFSRLLPNLPVSIHAAWLEKAALDPGSPPLRALLSRSLQYL